MKVLIISGTILPLPSDRLQMSPSGAAYIDMRPRIKSIVDTIKQNSNADIVLGGSGFNYYAKD